MLHAFVYREVALLVRHWLEIDLDDSHLEHGARIELRLRVFSPHRGTESAAQQLIVDRPLWRADLFDRLDSAPGAFDVAHYHPRFSGVEPSERHWAEELTSSPWGWLADQLADIGRLVTAAGTTLGNPDRESERVRADVPAIVAAAQARGPAKCHSAEQCHTWTQDVDDAVQLMVQRLSRPDLLDRDYLQPWRRSAGNAWPRY